MARSIGISAYKGDDLQGNHVFKRDIIKIGRLASAHLRLDDKKVSRIHAVVEVAANRDEVSITDMGSAEGTRVNGEKVSRARLKHGDEIGLGDSRLVLLLNEDEIRLLQGEEAPEENPTIVSESPAPPMTASAAAPADAPESTAVSYAPGPLSEFSMPGESPVLEGRQATLPPTSAHAEPTPAMTPVPTLPPTSEPTATGPSMPLPPARAAAPIAAPVALAPVMAALPPIPVDAISSANRYIEVTIRWGSHVVNVMRIREEGRFVVGLDDECDAFFPFEGAGEAGKHLLLEAGASGDWTFHGVSGMNGIVTQGRTDRTLSQMGQSFPIHDDMVVNASLDEFSVSVTPVSRSRVIPILPFTDHMAMRIALMTIFMFTLGISTLILTPDGLHDNEDDLVQNAADIVVRLQKKKKKKKPYLDSLVKKSKGKVGKRKLKKVVKVRTSKKPPPKKTNEQVVSDKLNKLFGDNNAMAAIFNSDSNNLLKAALGSVTSNHKGANALGSLTARGSGPGSGGVATGSFGVGTVSTSGRGTGNSNFGSAAGNMGNRKERNVRISQGTPIVMGSLDPSIIRRIVREHANQIKYCYERGLTKNPGLTGKIVMNWVIQGSGKVQRASTKSTTMKNKGVENCIAGKIKRWRFPKPKGGGIVIVNYPFVFKS
ncbi:MAG: AgmX/PglI C-terminal domain-containing protein [Deltaproteobacteria bacterium]|nr:AgmX/PglI C-terminal domain-containing protein [Deltaproteobacteria bacterium]